MIAETESGQRLDRYLTDRQAELSRTRLQSLIKDGHVLVNDRLVRPSYSVSPGDRINLIVPAPTPTDILAEDIHLNIVYEDEALAIINKPAGMVVHPAAGHFSGTLVNALLFHRAEQLSGIGGEIKPGIVHRLDKDTSGLIMVAKTDRAHQSLSGQLKDRSLTREYHALVWGDLLTETGRIDAPLGRHRLDRKRIAVNPKGHTREAVTHYKLLEKLFLTSYVKVTLETGRTHQIRVHFQYHHHPVVGDPVYGGRETYTCGLTPERRLIAQQMLKLLPRQALHAKRLAFIHPLTQERMVFDSDLPADFQKLLIFCREKMPL